MTPMTPPTNPAAPRRHPDIFTPDEAAAYLHLDSVRGLETLRREFGLVGHQGVNKAYIYHRDDLDRCALRMCGKDRAFATQGGALKISGSRA